VTPEERSTRFVRAWNVLHDDELARLIADQITAAVLEEREACAERLESFWVEKTGEDFTDGCQECGVRLKAALSAMRGQG
jgi:hypothetical protein